MISKLFKLFFLTGLLTGPFALAQEVKYEVDLTEVENDQLKVNLYSPTLTKNEILFKMPKIIPGTYKISDYGKFVSSLKAFDKKGKELPVEQKSTNTWEIKKAKKLHRIEYMVEDIFDTKIENDVYMMSASNIEDEKNFVIHPPAFFGYFDGLKKAPVELTFIKPDQFYGSTGLTPVSTSNNQDVFQVRNYDILADSPIMYNKPDTTFIEVGNTRVLLSVHSSMGEINSKYLAEKFEPMLKAQEDYLGGKLPVDKYAFIFYFADPATVTNNQGALEHNNSSFFFVPEMAKETITPYLVDVGAHEFFHIITPLTIHSEEIADFNFDEPVLSKHLWLYEGVTEYASDHIQVRQGLISENQFLSKLEGKLANSLGKFDDNLPFTELSKQAAGIHKNQYLNVYEKGALIAAMLDIQLIDLSKGKMDLQDLLLELGEKYGQDNPFEDDELIPYIESITYPEIGQFFRNYVEGSKSIPYEEILKKVGIDYTRSSSQKLATLGKVGLNYNADRQLIQVIDVSQLNEFGKAMGYQEGDFLVSLKGSPVEPAGFNQLLQNYNTQTKEGEKIIAEVLRQDQDGNEVKVTLSAPAMLVEVPGQQELKLSPEATEQQRNYRSIWLNSQPAKVSLKDVQSIDAIMESFYDVISGPAGERDWNRFHSLFKDGARMSSISATGPGEYVVKSFLPKDYEKMNSPFFAQHDFYEKELSREQKEFGEIAHVWSTYSYSHSAAPGEQRGINSIQLVFEDGRWWITDVLWNAERPGLQIDKSKS